METARFKIHDGLKDMKVGHSPQAGGILPPSERHVEGELSVVQEFRRSSSLEIETRDGDKVRINLQAGSQSLLERQGNHLGFLNWQGETYRLEIQGRLDEGELAAIKTLLQDVVELGQSFFANDMGAALEQAVSLDFDASELSSLDLRMRVQQSQGFQGNMVKDDILFYEPLRAGAEKLEAGWRKLLSASASLSNPRQFILDLSEALLKLSKQD